MSSTHDRGVRVVFPTRQRRRPDIQSTVERISADLKEDGPRITSFEELKSMAAEWADLLDTCQDEDIPKLKELLRIVVKEILVNSREEYI